MTHDNLITNRIVEIDKLCADNGFKAVVAMFSGGSDSVLSSHIATKTQNYKGIIHINTGTGIPDTTKFVRKTAFKWGGIYVEKKPFTTYEMLLVKYGFPGPVAHAMMYQYLKDRPLIQAKKEICKAYNIKNKEILLITGVRKAESRKREQTVRFYNESKPHCYCAPIYDILGSQKHEMIKALDLPVNPVWHFMHYSGECLCGANAHEGELNELDLFYPETAEYLKKCESLVKHGRELGLLKCPKQFTDWGHGLNKQDLPDPNQIDMFMCRGCELKANK